MDTINETTGIQLKYPLQIQEHDDQFSRKILETDHVQVYTIPLDHRIPTTGYLFREKVSKRKINLEVVTPLGVPYSSMKDIQNGKDWQSPDGRLIKNEEMTFPGRDPITFAYCSDTRYSPKIIPLLRNVNLLYHEATFGGDLADEAHNRGHSTALEAARIAKAAKVGKLIIGHFSARYKDPLPLLIEAQGCFRDTRLAVEGMIVSIDSQVSGHIE
jgi:ribonuclease Z